MNIKKIIFIFMIIFLALSFNIISYAVELNMTDDTDLTINSGNTTNSTDTNSVNTNNTDNYDFNINTNSNTYNTTNDYGTEYTGDSSSDLPATVSSVNSASDGELQLSDILNILLIVIGVLLILLSIAILIRLKR